MSLTSPLSSASVSDPGGPDTAVPYPLRVAAAVSWRLLAVVAVVVVVGYAVITLRVVVVPVAIAFLFCAGLGPIVEWLHRRRVPRWLAVTVVFVGGLATFVGLLTFVVQSFINGLPQLRDQVLSSIDEIQRYLEDPPFGLPALQIDSVTSTITDALDNNRGSITSGALSTAFTVGEFLTGFALVLFTLIFMLYGGASMWRFLIRVVPVGPRERLGVAGQRGYAALVGYVRATVLVAVVDAVGIGVGLLAVGAPLVVPLTALVFLSAFIPIVGAVVSGVVAVLVVLVANGPVSALVVLAVVLAVQQLEGNVLQPLLLGRAVSLNGLAVVLAVSVGSVLAGITGALLAVPLLAVVNAGVRSLVGEPHPDSTKEPNKGVDMKESLITEERRAQLDAERERIRTDLMHDRDTRPESFGRGIHHTALICSDVRQTVEFVQGVLGFPLTDMFENRDLAGSTHFFFDVGNGNTLAYFDLPGVDPDDYAEVLGGLHHCAISVPEDRWREIKGRFDERGMDYFEHSGSSIYFADPDGARMEIIYDPLGEMYGETVL